MGSYISIHNNTPDETVMVYIGANTKIIKPILFTLTTLTALLPYAATYGIIKMTITQLQIAEYTLVLTVNSLSSVTGGIVSVTNWVMENLQNKIVADLTKGGYEKILPGQTYTSKVTFGVNMRAWIVRIQKTEGAIILRRANSSVWSGGGSGGNTSYNVMDKNVFSNWKVESIPIDVKVPSIESSGEDNYSVLQSEEYVFTENEEHDSWINVDKCTEDL